MLGDYRNKKIRKHPPQFIDFLTMSNLSTNLLVTDAHLDPLNPYRVGTEASILRNCDLLW